MPLANIITTHHLSCRLYSYILCYYGVANLVQCLNYRQLFVSLAVCHSKVMSLSPSKGLCWQCYFPKWFALSYLNTNVNLMLAILIVERIKLLENNFQLGKYIVLEQKYICATILDKVTYGKGQINLTIFNSKVLCYCSRSLV